MKNRTSTYLKKHYGYFVLSLFAVMFMAFDTNAQDGKTLFKQNCGVCHTTTQQKLVGPGLEGIASKRKEEWLIKWIKDSQAFVASGDADAVKAFEDGGKVAMPPFANLTDADVKAIIAFVAEDKPAANAAPDAVAAAPVVKKEAPWSTSSKVFVALLVLTVIGLTFYLLFLKYNLRKLGYELDTEPFGDRVSKFFNQNGRFLLFIGVIVVAVIMKSCISEIMK